MSFVQSGSTQRRGAAIFAALALAALSGGCSTSLFGNSEPSASQASGQKQDSSVGTRIVDTILQKPPAPTEAEKKAALVGVAESTCPPVDVRAGASTLTLPVGNSDPFTLRYQGSFGEMARECNVTGGIMRMKIGIEGRLLVGPAGGAATLEVPVRYAVVKEGPEPKTVVSKLARVPVTVAEGQPNVIFQHVDNDIAFPMPPGLDIDAYVVYIGFDPSGLQQTKKPAAKPTAVRR